MKLVAQGVKHLAQPERLHEGSTLCGCMVTQEQSWRRIHALEGDECEKCVEFTFWTPSQNAGELGD